MQVPVARFRCRHPGCAQLDPNKNNFSMSTIYEHIAMHLQTDTGRSQQLNLRCSCSSQYTFVALSYATSHLHKYKREIHKHQISTIPITLAETDVSQKFMSYVKRFCGFYKYSMEEDKDHDLNVYPIIGPEETTTSQVLENTGYPMGMPAQIPQQMYPTTMQPMMFNPYGMPPNAGFSGMFPPAFPAQQALASNQEDIRANGNRTPARTPNYGSPQSPPRSSGVFQQPNNMSFQLNHTDTSFTSQRVDREASTSEFGERGRGGFPDQDQSDRGASRVDQTARDGYRGGEKTGRGGYQRGDQDRRGGYQRGDETSRGGFRGGDQAPRGRGGYRGADQAGRGHGGYRNNQSMDSRSDEVPPLQTNRRIREGASPRSSDDDEPAPKRPATAQPQYSSGVTSGRQRDDKDDERKPNPMISTSRLDTSSTAKKPFARDGASPRSDADNERSRNGASHRKQAPSARTQQPPRSYGNDRGRNEPSRPFDRNGGNSRIFDSTPAASNRGVPMKKKKGMGDISDRSDSD